MAQILVVADGGRARILRVTSSRPWGFEEIVELECPSVRLMRRELGTDAPGRVFPRSSRGSGPKVSARSSAGRDHDPRAGALLRFAKRLVTRLDRERQAGRMDSLLLIVEPKFLGLLREHLSAATRRRVRWEHPRDLVRADDKRLAATLTRAGVAGEVTRLGRPLRDAG